MSVIKNTRSQVFITTGGFIAASIMYVLVALEVLLGDLPSKGSSYSSTFYERNVGFFWAIAAIQAAYGLYWLAGGIRARRRQGMDASGLNKKGDISIDGVINIGAAICMILVGFCFVILPVVEVSKGQIYGGLIFKNHLLTAEPAVFRQLFIFHLAVSIVPIVGGLLLILFPPKRNQPVEARLNYSEQF